MNSAPDDLSAVASIFRGIKAGHHWCFGDQDYTDLNERFDAYAAFFARLELTLHRDGRGFIFATSNDGDHKGSEQITRFVVFTSVWIDAVADEGDDIGKRLFAEKQLVADLPHLRAEAHRRVLTLVGVSSPDDLLGVLRAMERFGLVELEGQTRFSLRVSFNRLLDVCLDAGRRAEAPSEAAPPVDAPTRPAEEDRAP